MRTLTSLGETVGGLLKARGETVVDVMWTERKHVRRARGGNPGQVTVSASKNLAVRVDQARIERLYGTLDADR